ncbi:MAG: Cerebroside-sulfatase, partial [Bacteroidetes bacterium QH_2_63_10]
MTAGLSVGRRLGAVLCVLAAGISLSLSPEGSPLSGQVGVNQTGERPPNIVLILADDLGRGDVRAYNADSKIPTPHMNRLATDGMQFTNAHSSASVCTPTRYGLLTGRYSWRTRLKQGVLWPPAEPLIGPDRETLATVLQGAGYRTAAVGKWHLGLDWGMQSEDKID